MSSFPSTPAVARTPGAVVGVRVLVAAQSAAALAGAALLGRLVAPIVTDRAHNDFGRLLGAAVLIPFAGAVLACGITLLVCATRLRRGADNIRTTLVAVQAVLLGGVGLLAGGTGRNLGFGAVPVPALVVGATAAAGLVGLLHPSCRTWTAR